MAQGVLVIDDDLLIRRLFTDVFKECGWAVDAVATADEALAALTHTQYDALLIDKNLPGMSGIDLVRRVRDTNERVVCAIITGYPSAESAMRAMQLGIDAYIEKPAPDPFWVVDKVEALVRKRAQRAAILEISRGGEHPDRRGEVVRAVVASPSAVDAGVVESWLRDAGVVVDTVIAASLASLEMTLNPRLNLLVLDSVLVKPSVPAYLAELRASGISAAFVIMTDTAPALRAVIEFIDFEVGAVLQKPVKAAELKSQLEPVLRRLAAP